MRQHLKTDYEAAPRQTVHRHSLWEVPVLVAVVILLVVSRRAVIAGSIRAGAAKVDITNRDAGPVNDLLFAKALALADRTTTVVLITVDAVAIGEIGGIRNGFLPNVRARLLRDFRIEPAHVLINASHCHGIVCADIEDRTVRAVGEALQAMVPVRTGAGVGHEDRIMQNRRMKLKNGREVDVRHAYSLPSDAEIAEVGPTDPQIGLLRLCREDGRTLAVVYNFACHPIQGVPSRGNTADLVGFASRVIEENLGGGAIALFVQGCGGDINPIGYKDVDHPRDAEPLGNLLGLSALRGLRQISCAPGGRLAIRSQTISLPRGDFAERIAAMEAEQVRLLKSLHGTSMNLKSFLPLAVKYGLSGDFPSAESHRYLHDRARGRDDLVKLDAENRKSLRDYIENIHTMEELTRVQTNLALLKKHQAQNAAAGKRTIDVEVAGLRVGDFVLVTFPGELTVRIGLEIKKSSLHRLTFVAGYTNGYIYYCPTPQQLLNPGFAQEDCDTLLAPDWLPIFEKAAAAILRSL
jgi:hypothetical protein